jgi:hypothetical protein
LWSMFSLCLHAQIAMGPTLNTFGVLGGSTVTNSGPTVVTGNLGVSPGTAITGFTGIAPGGPGTVTGSIHSADPFAAEGQNELTAAFNAAAAAPATANKAGDLGGQTLFPGVYAISTSIGLTGTLVLDAQGNNNAQFIFQIGSTLTTAPNSAVLLQNGAQAANVFWQVGTSATIDTNSVFAGNILAQASISLNTGASLQGRALARTGAVTLLSNVVTSPGGAGGAPPLTPSVSCASGSGQTTQVYSSSLGAIGGTPPYTFAITVGVLPIGLGINTSTGAITGTPTTLGVFPYTARVTDSTSQSATSTCSITISAPGPPATPAPTSLILVLTGLAGLGLYRARRMFTRAG